MKNTSGDNTYFMDQENAAELARLNLQDLLVTDMMGGVFPEPLRPGSRVLDLACGPGGWLLDVANQYHEQGVTCVGVDIDQTMVEYASAQAELSQLENVTFEVMDISKPFTFPDASFDVVNARLVGFFPPSFWPTFVAECYRLLRPGGTCRLAETEMGVSNSFALETWYEWFFQALFKAGQSFSTNGHRLTITATLAPSLRQAGFVHVKTQAFGLDWSFGTKAYSVMVENTRMAAKQIEPFFLAHSVAQQEDLAKNYTQMLTEIEQEQFAAMQYLLAAWGKKPETV